MSWTPAWRLAAARAHRQAVQARAARVAALLADETWRTRSDRWIAEVLGVRRRVVAGVRRALGLEVAVVVRRDGRLHTARRRPPAAPAPGWATEMASPRDDAPTGRQ